MISRVTVWFLLSQMTLTISPQENSRTFLETPMELLQKDSWSGPGTQMSNTPQLFCDLGKQLVYHKAEMKNRFVYLQTLQGSTLPCSHPNNKDPSWLSIRNPFGGRFMLILSNGSCRVPFLSPLWLKLISDVLSPGFSWQFIGYWVHKGKQHSLSAFQDPSPIPGAPGCPFALSILIITA